MEEHAPHIDRDAINTEIARQTERREAAKPGSPNRKVALARQVELLRQIPGYEKTKLD